MSTDPSERVVIARITTPYGVKGWVKVHSYTEPMDNIMTYQNLFLERNDHWQPIVFKEIKPHGKGFVALIDGVNDPDQARLYCQCNISVPAAALPEIESGEFYWHQLEGMAVYTQAAANEPLLLGKVLHMLETGANDVLVVGKSQGSIDERERLIPWLPELVIKDVDIEAGKIWVDWDPEF